MIPTESLLNYGRKQIVKSLGLTEREQEVAVLISLGFTNRQIAQKLFIVTRTVESHVYRINGKLGTHNHAEIVIRILDLALYFLNDFY